MDNRTPVFTDQWTSRAYVAGEILISLTALIGGGFILLTAASDSVRTVAATVVSAVVVFWFSRRAGEQATNTVKEATNGQLAELRAQVTALGMLRNLSVEDAAPIAAALSRQQRQTPPTAT